jgi:hypothetical protein
VGVKVTVTVQVAAAASEPPQLVAGLVTTEYSAESVVTETEIELIVDAVLLVNVTACVAADVPMSVAPKSKLPGLTVCPRADPQIAQIAQSKNKTPAENRLLKPFFSLMLFSFSESVKSA